MSSASIPANYSSDMVKNLIKTMVKALNEQDWGKYLSLWCQEEQNALRQFLTNTQNQEEALGILTVKYAVLKEIKKLSQQEQLEYAEVYEYLDRYQNVESYVVAIDYGVRQVNKYFYNGINYIILTVGLENSELKLLNYANPSLELIENLDTIGENICKNLDAYSSYRARDTAFRVKESRLEGFVVDSDMSVKENLIDPGETYTPPTGLRLRKVGDIFDHIKPSQIVLASSKGSTPYTVYFPDYVCVVTNTESSASVWSNEAMKAMIILVQQYGVYHVVVYDKYPQYNFDILDSTADQHYDLNKWNNTAEVYRQKITTLYNQIQHVYMSTQSGQLFSSHYVKNADWDRYSDYFYSIYQDDLKKWGDQGYDYQWMLDHFSYQKGEGVTLGKIRFESYYGWRLVNNQWQFYNNQGNQVFGWQYILDSWYYFDSQGNMQTGWVDGGRYYCNSSGRMITGWQLLGDNWYYFDSSSGEKQTGWLFNNGYHYYLGDDGIMRTGWFIYNGNWYYSTRDGFNFRNRWLEDPSGSQQWYWLQADGIMARDETLLIAGKYYDFDSSGLCLNNDGRDYP
ncbi:hypothetical protein FACS189418_2220 [Clostridia bacterium]|nr:hypothetical protein FACS189418_2220 [Clostridia bacterium]